MPEKLMPGECRMPDGDGLPICNEEGTLVRKDIEGGEVVEQEVVNENTTSESFGDKIAKIWNSTP